MRIFVIISHILLYLWSNVICYALDSQDMLERQRRTRPYIPPVITNQQQIILPYNSPNQRADNRNKQDRERSQFHNQSQESSSVSSQLPKPQTLSLNQAQISSDNFQPEAPTEYQYQAIQALCIKK
jgi:hypothetical protein